MKNIIHCDSLYNDIDQISGLITSLEFVDCLYGQEIEDFYYIPQGLSEMFSDILKEEVEVQHDTGTFRKPNTLIHFDNFYEHSLWSCIVALEDTQLKTYTHINGSKSFWDIPENTNKDAFFAENCMNLDKWAEESSINIRKNDFVFVRPWLWKSLEQDKIVQTFMLNVKIENK